MGEAGEVGERAPEAKGWAEAEAVVKVRAKAVAKWVVAPVVARVAVKAAAGSAEEMVVEAKEASGALGAPVVETRRADCHRRRAGRAPCSPQS